MSRLAILVLLALVGTLRISADAPGAAYPTEQEWIVATVCRNAFELLSFAKDRKGIALTPAQVSVHATSGPMPMFTVTVTGAGPAVTATLPMTGSIWSVAAYEPFCRAAAAALQVSPAGTAQPQGNPLHTLLDFTDSAIEAENQRVSQWLNAEPGNAAAQEQAALVLGMLAMKENSGFFWDPREMCSRACAHLAVAQILRPGTPTPEGGWAAVLVGLIEDTKTETGHEIDALAAAKNPSADLVPWVNAARMRNSRDWRIVKEPETASPFEQIEYFRALGEAVDTDKAVDWVSKSHLPLRPDWARIVTEEGYSVQVGHELVESSIGGEIKNMQATFPGSFQGAGWVDELNAAPSDVLGADGRLAVIDRGMWARYFQRHLCQAIAGTGDFFQNKWGVPENTAALDQLVAKTFPRLTLYPSLQIFIASQRPAPVDASAAAALDAAHPEWATYLLIASAKSPALEGVRQALRNWFNPPMLPGTAFEAFTRLPAKGVPKPEVDRLFAIAPLQFLVAQLELTTPNAPYTLARAQEVLGSMLDYYTPAIALAEQATGLTFDQKVGLMKKSASINPDNYFDLAHFDLDAHRDDDAAVAFQQWYDQAIDRVEVSNGMDWLVNYYFDHDQKDRAMSIAQEGAEVYSYGGLETMLKLLERMNRLDEAESYGQKIAERYNTQSALAAFYLRHPAQYQAKFDALVKDTFPQGLRQVTLASLSGSPAAGLRFAATNDAMQRGGLSSNQIIVALDGYAVEVKSSTCLCGGCRTPRRCGSSSGMAAPIGRL